MTSKELALLPKRVVVSPQRGGFISSNGRFESFLGVGIKPPGVVVRVVLSPIRGWFYAGPIRTSVWPLKFGISSSTWWCGLWSWGYGCPRFGVASRGVDMDVNFGVAC